MTFSVVDEANENVRTFDARSIAEDKAAGVKQMVSDPSSIRVVKGDYDDYEDYRANHDNGDDPETSQADAEELAAEIVDEREGTPVEPAEPTETAVGDDPLEQLGESLETDPLSILPGHMIDQIQGQPAINKRGYAMIAERYGVEVQAHIEEYPWDNEEGRCVARAVAETEDGKTYQDHATACAGDGDMDDQLIELASTRALKRVTGWSTGLGIVSYQELASELE